MDTITISTKNKETYSAVSNFFIDYYMTEANGEFVKIYLYLVRLLNSGNAVTVAGIADHFNLTEKDICRAVKYWIKQGALQLEYTKDKVLTGITLLPLSARTEDHEDDNLSSILDHASAKDAPAANTAALQETAAAETDSADADTAKILQSVSIPKKISYKPSFVASKKEDEDFGNLLYQTETTSENH